MQETIAMMLDDIDTMRSGLENAAMTLEMLLENIQMGCSDVRQDGAIASVVSAHLRQLNTTSGRRLENEINKLCEEKLS